MLKILFATSEVHPLIKTGGLADVSAALPIAIKEKHHDIRIILPAYQDVLQKLKHRKIISQITLSGTMGIISLIEDTLPDTDIPVYLVDYPNAFDRPGNPYVDANGKEWKDNAERFSLFCKAISEVCQDRADLHWKPDILHCNDWQTALAPALLNSEITPPATVFTIHNLAYQGIYPHTTFTSLGLDPELWSPDALEFHGQMSFIKGGIIFADRINAVSPRYAEEIQTEEYGFGLEGLLKYQSNKLSGILNGIDMTVWDPASDENIIKNYDITSYEHKKLNKAAIQEAFKLDIDPSILLIGFIGRLVEQKGIDLLIKLIPQLSKLPIQLAILGTGEKIFEQELQAMADKYPTKVGCKIGYSESLSHQIEAGSDVFVMPSKFEPCGLNQLYSLRYGTVPIVNNVGGLSDSIVNINRKNSNLKKATGFVMQKTSSEALYDEIVRAINCHQNIDTWKSLIENGMKRNSGWNKSANEYLKLYKQALKDNESVDQLSEVK